MNKLHPSKTPIFVLLQNELSIRLDKMQVFMEKLDLKMDSYEEKNGLLEGQNAANEMTTSRLEELIKTLAEKTARIDVIQTNMDLLVTKNSQNKIGLIERMGKQLDSIEKKNDENEVQIDLLKLQLSKCNGEMGLISGKVENLSTEIGSVVESQELTNSRIEENFKIQETAISLLEKDLRRQADDIVSIKTKQEGVTTLTKNIQVEVCFISSMNLKKN